MMELFTKIVNGFLTIQLFNVNYFDKTAPT